MVRYLSFILMFMLSQCIPAGNAGAHDDEYRALAPILAAADNFFRSLKDGDFNTAWDLLSERSHRTIIDDVFNVTRKVNKDINRDDVVKDFQRRGKMFTHYWNSFQRSFDADVILENSEWEMGSLRNDEAEIIITNHNGDGPTTLKMLRERDSWKVGLTETFWQRRALNLLHIILQ